MFELIALLLLSKMLYHLNNAPSRFFALDIFLDGVAHYFFVGLASDYSPSTYTTRIAGIIDVHHCTHFLEMRSC
jgi:hypothetical protein